MSNSKTTLHPDQSHIDQVRDALWQRSGGGASVMVGSGFSRSAARTRPGAEDIPMWPELAEAIYNSLYPQDHGASQCDKNSEILRTDGFLKIAQEYEVAFGRTALHGFLQQLVRDDDFKFGDMHKRLLRLPWRDVFTTNWDTLLEETGFSVADRAYSYGVVQSMDEIPLAARPRIVKLHGSFPAYFPLICTEEDYRKYPTQFAPFVNTVQQSMMETVFLLIGFSGNDPNFLNWSGWVRDNLGDAAPKIYLAGWLDLSSHRRRMLENRNVISIDLAHHPKADKWPKNFRHKYATDWILHTLERGRPLDIKDIVDWPSQKDWKYVSIPPRLRPVIELPSEGPKKEIKALNIKPEELLQRARQALDIWIHNRKLYPDWLVIPISARYNLNYYTNQWEPKILHVLSDFSPLDRLKAIRELIWRREILLDPISPELESVAEETLELVNCQDRTIKSMDDIEIDWIAVREAWRTIELALVTVARYRFDHDVFIQRISALLPFCNDDPNVAHRLDHERCLWAMYSMDFEALEDLLGNWQTENCDPAWMMRKASLLFETGRSDEAKELIKVALKTIREMPPKDHSLAGPSREAWILWSRLADRQENRQDIIKRWQELSPLKCNALFEKSAYADGIKTRNRKNNKPLFDLGMRQGDIIHISNDEYYQYIAAWRVIRLSEVAGLPPVVDRMNIAADILKPATEKLAISDLEMAARLILRVETNAEDETLMRVISRMRVASMSMDLAKTLVEICDNVIKYTLPRMVNVSGKRNLFWIEKMRVAIEILSRLVLRLDADMAESILDRALEYYRNDRFIQNWELGWPLRNLLKRSWEALPEDRRTKRFFDLLSAPIAGVDNFALIRSNEYEYPDPGFLLQDDFPPPVRTDDNTGQWQSIVDLLVRGLQSGGGGRKRAARRIGSPAFRNKLTKSESLQIAQALWDKEYTDPNGLPGGTSFRRDWVFLRFPEPEEGLAERRFRLKWLSSNDLLKENGRSLDDILWQVGNAIYYLRRNGCLFALSDEEQSFVKKMLQRWLEAPVQSDDFPFKENQLREPIFRALSGLSTLILEIEISENIGEKLYAKMQHLNQLKIPAFGLIPSLVRVLPNKFDEIVLLMKTGLASEHENLSINAVQGLRLWLEMTTDLVSLLREPPEDLVREIGVIIAVRRKGSLVQALQAAKWLFDAGRDTHRETIKDLVLQGLGFLTEELRYDREHDQDEQKNNPNAQNDIPLQRLRCARLALSMANQGLKDDPVISRWLEIAKQDPLPEVRYVDKTAVCTPL